MHCHIHLYQEEKEMLRTQGEELEGLFLRNKNIKKNNYFTGNLTSSCFGFLCRKS